MSAGWRKPVNVYWGSELVNMFKMEDLVSPPRTVRAQERGARMSVVPGLGSSEAK